MMMTTTSMTDEVEKTRRTRRKVARPVEADPGDDDVGIHPLGLHRLLIAYHVQFGF